MKALRWAGVLGLLLASGCGAAHPKSAAPQLPAPTKSAPASSLPAPAHPLGPPPKVAGAKAPVRAAPKSPAPAQKARTTAIKTASKAPAPLTKKQVLAVQLALTRDGYPAGPENGSVGALTLKAVKSFEAAYNMPAASPLSKVAAAAARAGAPARKAVLAYWVPGGGGTAAFTAHAGAISALAPLWFTVTSTGALRHRGPDDITPLTRLAHARGKKVYALITNAGGNRVALHSAAIRDAAVRHIVSAVKSYGLDGVNIDFERLDGQDAGGLAAFVKDLHGQLAPLGLTTTVDVGPALRGNLPLSDPTAAYDYRALGQAADRIAIMTYDQHGPGTAPGPVSGMPWMRRVVQYAVTQIPRQKILLGLAAYGYDWTGGGATTVSARSAEALQARQGAQMMWSAAQLSPHFSYPGHTIWFSSSSAVAARLPLVRSFGLGGVALWRLGEADAGTFPAIQKALSVLP